MSSPCRASLSRPATDHRIIARRDRLRGLFLSALPGLRAEAAPDPRAWYVSPGRVQFIWREFPIRGVHPTAQRAAEYAVCAGQQGKFMNVFDQLFRVAPTLTPADIPELSKTGGLRESEFAQCVQSRGGRGRVVQDQTSGRAIGVYATPTFFLGTRANDGSVAVHARITGSEPVARFRQGLSSLTEQK